ncbi:sulfate transporter-like [Agrilus planipennis]|nr:sulfate transporter-like [Agrilus planipennis]
MYTFRLGIASMLLSESLVSGFTTGAAVQVMTSQIKDLFGLSIEKMSGKFEVIYTYLNIFQNITTTNVTALLISTITIFILTLNNEIIKPKVAKLCSFPIPIELIAVVAGTLLSKFLFLDTEYSIKTVGDIPQG